MKKLTTLLIMASWGFSFTTGPRPHFVLTAGPQASADENQFVQRCLCQRNISDLFPQDLLRRQMMDSMRTVKASISIRWSATGPRPCTGIYFYKLYSFWPNPKWRDLEFLRGFCLVGQRLYALSPTDSTANRRLFRRLQPRLVQQLGSDKVRAEEKYFISGGIYVQ